MLKRQSSTFEQTSKKSVIRLLYYGFILPLSWLPLFVLHGISDILYLIVYYLFGYRKKIVRRNIEKSFPDKKVAEHRQIERLFYRHFCDLIVEGVKNFNIPKEEVMKRFVIQNSEMVDSFFHQKRHVIILGGHYNNWELYALSMPLFHDCKGLGIYKPIHNRFMDQQIRQSRGKYGMQMVPMKETKTYFQKSEQGKYYGFVLGGDQSPKNPKKAFWTTFLNQDTAVLYGAEKFAREYNAPTVFGEITKVKRGYYTLKYHLVSENPELTEYGEITRDHTKILEKMIVKEPQFWLWSHNRWKHRKPN